MAKRYHESRKFERSVAAGKAAKNRGPERSKGSDRGDSFGGVRHRQPEFNDRFENDQDEDRPLYNNFRLNGNEFYAGMEPRRRQEMQDAGYIREDNDAVANLPQNVIMRPYPKTGPYMPEGLDDSIEGVDMQMDEDDRGRRNHFLPKKV